MLIPHRMDLSMRDNGCKVLGSVLGMCETVIAKAGQAPFLLGEMGAIGREEIRVQSHTKIVHMFIYKWDTRTYTRIIGTSREPWSWAPLLCWVPSRLRLGSPEKGF